jgi:hypothetical protein
MWLSFVKQSPVILHAGFDPYYPYNIVSRMPLAEDVMQGARRIYSGLTWHKRLLP